MIEAAVCFLLISLGLSAWGVTRLGRRVYGNRPPPAQGVQPSFLENLFGNAPPPSSPGRLPSGAASGIPSPADESARSGAAEVNNVPHARR